MPLSAWYGHARLADHDDLDRSVHVKIRADGNHVGGRGWQNVVERFAKLRAEMPDWPAIAALPCVMVSEDPVVISSTAEGNVGAGAVWAQE